MFRQKYKKSKMNLLFIVYFLLFPLSAFCLASDRNKPIIIAADLSLLQQTHIVIDNNPKEKYL